MKLPAALSRRSWPTVALVASLILNAFLIGMLVVDAVRPHGRGRGDRMVTFELRRFADRLPDEAVEEVRAKLLPLRPNIEERFARFRAIREEIGRLAAEPTPDRAAIDERLAALRAESEAMQQELQTATYDAILELPPEARAQLAESPKRD
jgi:uncharacterized membrane protein